MQFVTFCSVFVAKNLLPVNEFISSLPPAFFYLLKNQIHCLLKFCFLFQIRIFEVNFLPENHGLLQRPLCWMMKKQKVVLVNFQVIFKINTKHTHIHTDKQTDKIQLNNLIFKMFVKIHPINQLAPEWILAWMAGIVIQCQMIMMTKRVFLYIYPRYILVSSTIGFLY